MPEDFDQPELDLVGSTGAVSVSSVSKFFEPARLTQARVLKEWSKAELAERVPVTAAAIGQYEAGIAKPRSELLPLFAKHLGFPVEFFASGRALGRMDSTHAHFRSLRSTRVKDRAKASAYVEQVWELTTALERRVRFPALNLPDLPAGNSPEAAAAAMRDHLGITRGPVTHLAGRMESAGIIITTISMTDDAFGRISAFSTDAFDRPIVVITPERLKSVYRYRFTCAHELGHLLLHANPIAGDRDQEREADRFAAEFLTPKNEIEPQLPGTVRLPALNKLSNSWGVSVQSLLKRMAETGRASDLSIRRAYQRLNTLAEVSHDHPLTEFPGEQPTLLRDAVELAAQHGYTQAQLATDLCWKVQHLDAILGTLDERPKLRTI
jgi:Zn-dependent peptidase ImmA (M78 family)/transcriptional regulator with XRE-family HTH domain